MDAMFLEGVRDHQGGYQRDVHADEARRRHTPHLDRDGKEHERDDNR
jgi:hypothetical protein